MALSGSIDFTVTRDDLIQEALEELGVVDIGETPPAAFLTTCTRKLNLMLKGWQGDGVNLFAVQKTFLFLSVGVNEYKLGTTADYVTQFTQTTTANDHGNGSNSILLSDTTGIVNGTVILAKTTTGDLERLTASGPAVADLVPLTTPIVNNMDTGGVVFYYQAADVAARPMKILDGTRRESNTTSSTDIPLDILTRRDYVSLSNKDATGVPVQIYQNPEIDFLRVRTWPAPNDASFYYVLWVQRTLDDLDGATDNPAYPQEWQEAIALNLAHKCRRRFGIPASDVPDLARDAQLAYDIAFGYDREDSFRVVPADQTHQ
jgi:hypothetical protein